MNFKKFIIASLCLIFSFAQLQGQDLNGFFDQADNFFKTYAHNGNVQYDKLQGATGEIGELYKIIGSTDLSAASLSEKKAFYINAYNLIVIFQISKYYPLKSALDQSGFFDKVKHQVAGQSMTLNRLEIIELLKNYQDSRIHFVLACAAKGCPKLASFAYYPGTLESKLQERTLKAINDPYFIRMNAGKNAVEVSMIFKWYANDFGKSSDAIIKYINKYRKSPIPNGYSLGYYEYDWSLNM